MRSLCLIVAPLLLLFATSLFPDDKKEKNTSWYWKTGLSIARTGEPDSAFPLLKQAFAKHLGDDSLYYLWAEIFLYKNIPDTALALNLSITSLETSALKQQVIEQRYLIYTTLGWDKKAQELIEKTSVKKQSLRSRLLPECNIYLSGGAYLEKNRVDKNYPNPRMSDSIATENNGIGNAALRISWNINTAHHQKLQLGGRLRYSGSRFSVMHWENNRSDSSDISAGAYARYSLLSDMLSFQYLLSRRMDYRNDTTWVHSGMGRYAFFGNSSAGTIEAGYQFEAPVKEQYYYLLFWWDYFLGLRNDFSFNLLMSGFSAQPYSFTTLLLYSKNGRLFTDAACTIALPIITQSTTIEAHCDTLRSAHSIPLGYWNIAPDFRYERELNDRFSIGAGGSYGLSWYREKYSWLDFGQNRGDKYSDFEILIFNQADEQYYLIDTKATISNAFTPYQNPVSLLRKRRIDQSISLDLFTRGSFGRFGDLSADLSVRRTFSTLAKSAPVDIQEWYGDMTLTWFFRFRPDAAR